MLELPAGTLTVNAEVRGSLRVALLDPAGKELPGRGFADCRPLSGDSLRHEVAWKGGSTVDALAGRPVRIKLRLEDATFHAFTVG